MRPWLVFAVLMGLLVTGCGSDDTTKAAAAAGVETFTGAAHCGWESVEFIQLPKDLLPVRHPGDQWVDFARDTEGALNEGMVDGTYQADTRLPAEATDTGLTTEYGTLWVVPDNNDVVYVVQPDGSVQKWPATSAGCD